MITSRVRWLFGRQRIWQPAISSFVAVVIFLVAWRFAWLTHLEDRLYDVGLNLRSAPAETADCVIVAIDSASIADWSRPIFPISRHLASHTRLVQVLDSIGAKVICFDILFDQIDSLPQADIIAFADACKSAGSVLLATSIEQLSGHKMIPISVNRVLLPHPKLISSIAGTGVVDVPLDADNRIRRTSTGISFRDALLLSISTQASRLYGEVHAEGDANTNLILIDYSWIQRISVISYRDVIKSGESIGCVKDKIVFVGATLSEGGDNYPIPITGADSKVLKVPGVVIQAAATQTLISGTQLKLASIWSSVLILLGLAGALSLFVFGRHSWITIVALGVCAVAIIAMSPLAVVYWGTVYPIGKWLIALACYLAVHWIVGISWLRRVTVSQQGVIRDFHADMKSAQVIQQHLQPRTVPKVPGLDIAVMQLTCQEVGGDYYDFLDFGKGRIGILIGDVAGKGMAASLIMSNVQAIFREEARHATSPSEVLRVINRKLNEISSASGRFMSLFYGILDSSNGVLTYSNAGHCRPIVCSSDGVLRELSEGGLFLGPFEQSEWCDCDSRIVSGDKLCVYTDGVSEAYDKDIMMQFGEERIARCLQEYTGNSEETLNHLLDSCRTFVRELPFKDDWTAIIVQYNAIR